MVASAPVPVVQPQVPSLYEVFEQMEDPRRKRGVRYPLAGLLSQALAAILCDQHTLAAIAQWGRERKHLAVAFGYRKRQMPCLGAFHYLFQALNAQDLNAALHAWFQAHVAAGTAAPLLHLDGKSLRGAHAEASPCIHLLSAYSPAAGTAIAQLRVSAKTNEHKGALELLGLLPLRGVVVTGDAAFTQRDLSRQIMKQGGDYVLAVKENQPTLHARLQGAFAAPFPPAVGCGVGG